MFVGNLENLGKLDFLAPKLKEVLIYLKENDLKDTKPGRIELQGEDLFINIELNEMAPKEERKPEAHIKYLDIQLVLDGAESIGVAVTNKNNTVLHKYDDEKDIMFFEDAENENMIDLFPGDFTILFPEDIHRPRCLVSGTTSGSSKKAIVKMKLNLLK